MDKLSEHAIRMLEIVDGENDFFRNDSKRQADIAKAVYDTILQVQMLKMTDRKTEPNCSEKPNNSTCSILEQVDKDTNVRSKYDCETCKHYNPDHEAIACERCLGGKYSRYEPKTEPQTDCKNCNNHDRCVYQPKDESQTYVINPQEPTNDDKCFECEDFFTCGGRCNKIEDEPQPFDKPPKCLGCLYSDLDKAFHPCASCVDFGKYVGEVSGKDEPQTEVETMSCEECKHYRIGKPCEPFLNELDCRYEPKTEPQKCYLRESCDHYGDKQVCGRCREYNLYSHTKTEPQTERSE